MVMRYVFGVMLCLAATGVCTAARADPAAPSSKRPPADPNEKVCEDITMVGSRLATKRICATRAEWAARKRDDREMVEKIQTQICVINPATGACNGQ